MKRVKIMVVLVSCMYVGVSCQRLGETLQCTDGFSADPIGTRDGSNAHKELLAHWPMDEGGNNILHDRADYANHGVINGAAWSSGGGLVFDGIDDYVEVPDDPSLNPRMEMTITAWFHPVEYSGTGNDVIVEKPYWTHYPPFYQYHLGVNDQGKFIYDMSINGEWVQVTTNNGFWEPHRWYFLTGRYNGTSVALFVDASLIVAQQASGPIDIYNMPLRMGAFVNIPYGTPGVIDNVRIFSYALSETQIDSIYLLGREEHDTRAY